MEVCYWDNESIFDYYEFIEECQKRVRNRYRDTWTETDKYEKEDCYGNII